jgi:hypothetical protein
VTFRSPNSGSPTVARMPSSPGRPDKNLSGLTGAVRLSPVFASVASRSLTGDSRSPCYFQRGTRSERTPVIDKRMAVSGFRHADAPEYDDVVAAAH